MLALLKALFASVPSILKAIFGMIVNPATSAQGLAYLARVQAVVDKVKESSGHVAAFEGIAGDGGLEALPVITPAELEKIVTDLEAAVPAVTKLVMDIAAILNPAAIVPPAPAGTIPTQ